VEPVERRLQSTTLLNQRTIPIYFNNVNSHSNTTYKEDEEDRNESWRRLQQLLKKSALESHHQTEQQQNQQQQHAPLLPRWTQDVVANYGSNPIILGLESCSMYQQLVPRQHHRVIAPAGLFHTGTNLLMTLLEDHCRFSSSEYGNTDRTTHQGLHAQVPWGKHHPAFFRDGSSGGGVSTTPLHHEDDHHHDAMSPPHQVVLPVVMISHPYEWMKHMCQQPVTANWNVPQHPSKPCPYVVRGRHQHHIPVQVQYGRNNNNITIVYESMAHLWNQWNRGYYDTRAYPRLMIRYEDLLFYPDQVIPTVCQCAGGTYSSYHNPTTTTTSTTTTRNDDGVRNDTTTPLESVAQTRILFRFTAQNVEDETLEMTTSLEDAWRRYGKTPTLMNISTEEDILFMQRILDKDMLRAFHYKI
jgi:hypothetical protein